MGNSITLSEWEGSTTGSVAAYGVTAHLITNNIYNGKIVILSLSGSGLPSDNNCTLQLINYATEIQPTYSGGWYATSRMKYFETTDTANYSYYIKVISNGYAGNYTINIKVVNAINTFTKLDSKETSISLSTYVVSNSSERLNSNYYKGEWGYYLQRSKVQGNSNIFWEHQNQLGFNATFGVLLWNKDNIPLTIRLNKRSFKSYMSEGSMESAMCGIWVDWFNNVIQNEIFPSFFRMSKTSMAKAASKSAAFGEIPVMKPPSP